MTSSHRSGQLGITSNAMPTSARADAIYDHRGRYRKAANPNVGLHAATHPSPGSRTAAVTYVAHWPDDTHHSAGNDMRIGQRFHPSRVRANASSPIPTALNAIPATSPASQATGMVTTAAGNGYMKWLSNHAYGTPGRITSYGFWPFKSARA